MTSISDSVSCGLPKNDGRMNILFSGTYSEFKAEGFKKRLYTVPLDYNPRGRLPITLLQEGDYTIYSRYFNGRQKTFIIDEIHAHGGDENKRVVVAKDMNPAAGEEDFRTVFDAQYLPGEKMIDLITPQVVKRPNNIYKVVLSRQLVNERGGYNR